MVLSRLLLSRCKRQDYVCDQEGAWPGRHRLDHDCLSISEPCILPSWEQFLCQRYRPLW